MNSKIKSNDTIYFIPNRCSQTIGGVQTKMRLIEKALPEQQFVEIPLVYNEKDIKLDKLPNVEVHGRALDKSRNKKRYFNIFEANAKRDNQSVIQPNSKLIVFGVQKLFFLSKEVLENNEIIIFQSNRPDVTFGTIQSKKVPFILLNKVKYIDKFLFYTEADKKEIIQILDHSKAEYHFKSYVVPNPSKTSRNQISQYSNNIMYMGRFDMIQKNINAYIKLAERISPTFKINAYGDGFGKPLLENSKVYLGGVIKDITQVARENSILLLLSNYEGFGNVILEAYSVGMPVIVYDSYPAARSIVTNGAGKLIPHGDIQGVEKAIGEILKDEETFKTYSDQAFLESKKYNKERIVQRYINVILD